MNKRDFFPRILLKKIDKKGLKFMISDSNFFLPEHGTFATCQCFLTTFHRKPCMKILNEYFDEHNWGLHEVLCTWFQKNHVLSDRNAYLLFK